MRFANLRVNGARAVAVPRYGDRWVALIDGQPDYPGTLEQCLQQGWKLADLEQAIASAGSEIDIAAAEFLPPVERPEKIICVGLNYADHAAEGNLPAPESPVIFGRYASSLLGHEQPMLVPKVSHQLDYEGEIAAVIGRPGRHIREEDALDHVAGYALFNEGSVRDYQLRTSQWTLGKTFDATGAFGPFLVAAEAVPPGCAGMRLTTRLNGQVVQDASTDDMIFSVATLIAHVSAAFELAVGDVLVTGTPAGIGATRTPPLYMRAGDVCEVEVPGLGVLRNPIRDEASAQK